MNPAKIVLQIGGSQAGPEYRFVADEETLRLIAHQILDCLDGRKVGPWGVDSGVIVCEDVEWQRQGLLSSSSEVAFLTLEKKKAQSACQCLRPS